jgi:hypothetical protein
LTGAEYRTVRGIRFPDHPAPGESLYRLRYPSANKQMRSETGKTVILNNDKIHASFNYSCPISSSVQTLKHILFKSNTELVYIALCFVSDFSSQGALF